MSQQKTLQQKRAAQAHTDVNRVSGDAQKEYGSLVRGLPALVQSDGLASTLVFLKAKGKTHHRAAYDHVSMWVMGHLTNDADDDLLEWLLKVNSFEYRQATTEALAYIAWLKRFAEARGLDNE
jgi:CRISPR-associated protein Cmr5